MIRFLGILGASAVGLAGMVVLVVVVVLAPLVSVIPGLDGSGVFPGWGSGAVPGSGETSAAPVSGMEIAAAAQLLEEHVYGPLSNEYKIAHDPIMQAVYQFWVDSCGSNGVICDVAVSGNLQCVEFVTGAMYLSGIHLPYAGDAITFWSHYAVLPGWTRIATSQGYPQPGDLVIWQGGMFGHIAVVMQVQLPTKSSPGFVTVAQGNGQGNRWDVAHMNDPGNWYTMPLFWDGSLATWNGYTVLGYIRAQIH